MERLCRFFASHGSFFIWLLVLNLPYLIHLYLFHGRSMEPMACLCMLGEGFVRLGAMSFFVTVLCCWLPQWAKRLFLGVFFVLFLVDAFTLFHYSSVLDSGMFQVIFETNPKETAEYFTMQAAHVLMVLLGGIGAGLLFWRFLLPRLVAALSCHARFLAAGIFVGLLLFTAATVDAYTDEEQEIAKDYPMYFSVCRLADIVPSAYHEVRSAEYVSYFYDRMEVTLTRNESTIPYVVFVLGESTSRHHMGIYGYALPTTPHLSARNEAGELAVFRDVISPHAGTMAVLKTLFSFYDVSCEEAGSVWYEYGNLFDILKKAGYHTAWLSNQESAGFYGTVGRAFASRCDDGRFTMVSSHTIDLAERYDEQVLPLLDSALSMAGTKNFFVVHLMGAHEDYKRRYPQEFSRFTAEDEQGDFSEKQKKLRAEYDNSLLYNDYIVDEIIRRFEDKNAVIVYISDHAEEVYDMGRDVASHGDETSARQREIPMLIWTSQSFRQSYPELAGRMQEAVSNPYVTDSIIHTLLDLMGIETMEYREERSILRQGMENRTLKGGMPYQPTRLADF